MRGICTAVYHYKYHSTTTDKNGWHKIYTAAEGSTIQDVSLKTEEQRPTFDLDFGSTYLITVTIDESINDTVTTGEVQGDIFSLNFMLSIPKEEKLTMIHTTHPDFAGVVFGEVFSSLTSANAGLHDRCEYYLRVGIQSKLTNGKPNAVIDLMRKKYSETAYEIYTSSSNVIEPVKFECFKII